MREILIHVPTGQEKAILKAVEDNGGMNILRLEAKGEKASEVIIAYFPNRKVEALMGQIQDIPDLHLTLQPRGSIPLHPPASAAPEQVTQVEERSPIEVFLGGLQSVGSWKGFLGYAAAAGVVVWIGLFTNTTYLLVAAMLIAPFAGPAMNAAIATARGDVILLRRSLLRYFAGLGLTIIVAGALSLIFRQDIPTSLMIDVSQISMVAVLLPLAAGAAGALNLIQSERSSLVSGAAVGMLVAASLSPPAGLLGMASIMGRWDLTKGSLFLLPLQLAGINLSGSLVFRLYGLTSRGARYERGQRWMFLTSLTATILLLAGLLSWQHANSPNLQRSSIAQRATKEVQKVVEESGVAQLVEANVRFTRPNLKSQETLLCVVYVQSSSAGSLSNEQIRSTLTQEIHTHLLQQGFSVTPLIDVNVLKEPSGQ
jgi:uncharacterized hydrophobic protein (TIGR00271 family)